MVGMFSVCRARSLSRFLRAEERSAVEALARRSKTSRALALRVRIALACAEGFIGHGRGRWPRSHAGHGVHLAVTVPGRSAGRTAVCAAAGSAWDYQR